MRAKRYDGDAMKPFMVLDDRISILVIAADYAVAIAIIVLAIVIDHPLMTFVAIAVVAGRQIAFLNLVHAAAHYSLFSVRRMNDRVDLIIAYLIFDGVRPYRSAHLLHHRLFNREDPERFDYLDDRLLGHNDSPWSRTWKVLVKPLLGGDGIAFVRSTAGQARENPWWTLRLAGYWAGIVAVFWWAGWLRYLLLYWIVPLLWLYPVFYGWAELTDHFAVRYDARNQRGLFYSLFLKGHEMYHAIHHVNPRIPFYRIKAASKYLGTVGEEFEETRGIVDFMKILYRRTPRNAALPAATDLGVAPIAQGSSLM